MSILLPIFFIFLSGWLIRTYIPDLYTGLIYRTANPDLYLIKVELHIYSSYKFLVTLRNGLLTKKLIYFFNSIVKGIKIINY
jgi:hypothetical protein